MECSMCDSDERRVYIVPEGFNGQRCRFNHFYCVNCFLANGVDREEHVQEDGSVTYTLTAICPLCAMPVNGFDLVYYEPRIWYGSIMNVLRQWAGGPGYRRRCCPIEFNYHPRRGRKCCRICWESEGHLYVPTTLNGLMCNAAHRFCYSCLTDYVGRSLAQSLPDTNVRCPVCNSVFIIFRPVHPGQVFAFRIGSINIDTGRFQVLFIPIGWSYGLE